MEHHEATSFGMEVPLEQDSEDAAQEQALIGRDIALRCPFCGRPGGPSLPRSEADGPAVCPYQRSERTARRSVPTNDQSGRPSGPSLPTIRADGPAVRPYHIQKIKKPPLRAAVKVIGYRLFAAAEQQESCSTETAQNQRAGFRNRSQND